MTTISISKCLVLKSKGWCSGIIGALQCPCGSWSAKKITRNCVGVWLETDLHWLDWLQRRLQLCRLTSPWLWWLSQPAPPRLELYALWQVSSPWETQVHWHNMWVFHLLFSLNDKIEYSQGCCFFFGFNKRTTFNWITLDHPFESRAKTEFVVYQQYWCSQTWWWTRSYTASTAASSSANLTFCFFACVSFYLRFITVERLLRSHLSFSPSPFPVRYFGFAPHQNLSKMKWNSPISSATPRLVHLSWR